MYDLLDKQRIITSIQPKNRRNLACLEIFETIDSTNNFLLNQAKNNAPSGSVCLAEQQTQGRGRRGRKWESPPGANIYCSMLWRFDELSNDMSGLGLAVATIVLATLKKYGVGVGVQLKWPNDVLFDGRKLAGILLESSDRLSVVIGVGLNVLAAPEMGSAVSIAEILRTVPVRNALVGLLIDELLEQLPRFEAQGLGVFLPEWRKYDVLSGKRVEVHLPDKVLGGLMRGVDEHGRLLLEDESGVVQRFSYGEVSVRKSEG